MQIDYNKETKTMEILGLTGLDSPILYINDNKITELEESNNYVFSKDSCYKITVKYLDSGEEVVSELGYVLVVEYAKSKNRKLLVSILDEAVYYGLSEIWIKVNKIIREIECSFELGNLGRVEILFKELNKC